MANAISQTLGNIPPKARLMLGITIVVGAVAVTAFVNKFGSNPEDQITELAGQAKITSAPDKNDIKKTEAGEETLIPKDSPLGEQIEEARQEEIQEAKKKGGGYMDRLDLSNEKLLEEKEEVVDTTPKIKAFEDIDVSNGNQNQNNAQQQYNINNGNGTARRTNMAVINEAEFLRAELERYNNVDPYSGYIAKIGQTSDRPSGKYQSRASALKASSNNGQASSLTNTRSSSSNSGNVVDRYIRDSSRLPKVNEGDLNKYRDIGKGKNPSQSRSQQPQRTAYQEMANPISYEEVVEKELVNLGELHYGILQISVNTDEPGPVRAYIPGNGKVGESVLLGEPVRVNEKVSIMFNNMTKDGVDYPIKAIALDPDTMRPGIADSVDRHIFERYFKLAVAAAADGYVSALTGSTSTTNSDGSTNTVIERLPDASDQLAVALGSVGRKLIPQFERQFERPPTVEVNGNRDIIIMFMSSVEVQK